MLGRILDHYDAHRTGWLIAQAVLSLTGAGCGIAAIVLS